MCVCAVRYTRFKLPPIFIHEKVQCLGLFCILNSGIGKFVRYDRHERDLIMLYSCTHVYAGTSHEFRTFSSSFSMPRSDLPTFYEIKAEDLPPIGKKPWRVLCSENITILYLPGHRMSFFPFQHHQTAQK